MLQKFKTYNIEDVSFFQSSSFQVPLKRSVTSNQSLTTLPLLTLDIIISAKDSTLF